MLDKEENIFDNLNDYDQKRKIKDSIDSTINEMPIDISNYSENKPTRIVIRGRIINDPN